MRGGALTLDLDSVDKDWPLISFLRDDPIYYQKYLDYMEEFVDEVFTLEELVNQFQSYHDLIESYVRAEDQDHTLISSLSAFDSSISDLVKHVRARLTAVESFLETGPE
jgi:hypothetical protein